ncbi:MAG: hypothetical protein MUD12_17085 [Spirochaetes bacterium]|nr:hypothetical protein [Spirochaetota bacterium]
MRYTAMLALSIILLLADDSYPRRKYDEKCFQSKDFKNLSVRLAEVRKGCTISAGETFDYAATRGDRYRSFMFMPNGQVMVFTGTKDDERMSRSTGSRYFHLLPFKTQGDPSYSDAGDGTVDILSPGGHRAKFSTENGEPVFIEGITIKLYPLRHIKEIEKNNGLMDITPEKGRLLIDYGWRTGEVPITQLWRNIEIKDGHGNVCKAKMSEVFRVDPKDKDEVFFIHDTNARLRQFLKKKCPKITYED